MMERNILCKIQKFRGSVSFDFFGEICVNITPHIYISNCPNCAATMLYAMPMQALPPPSLEWCLFLDVDGTLIEFTDSPLETFADADLKTLLGRVAERLGGAVALVSGR